MSGLQKNLTNPVSEVLVATRTPPVGGDFVWDGKDEDDRPMSKAEMRKGMRGRPKLDTPKQSTTVRFDAEVIEFFKRGGKGWQTRMNEVLREYVAEQSS